MMPGGHTMTDASTGIPMEEWMRIRNAEPRDRASLHDLLTRSWLENWAPHVSAASVERFRNEDPVAGYLSGYLSSMTVAEEGGRILGMMHLVGDRVAAVHVLADAQGRGVGAGLMEHAEGNGGRTLEVRAFNARAIRFYEKRGWRAVRHYEDDEFGTPLETIEMVLVERT
jgi:GNAT superfamily N-acetyltransferase